MPYINLKKKTKKETNQRNEHTDSRELRRTAYNNSSWRKLRNTYIKEHPICEDCLSNGKITPAEDIHHIESPFKNGEINYHKLLDSNNLVALCKQCHSSRHNKEQGHISVEEVIKQLADLLNPKIKDEDLE